MKTETCGPHVRRTPTATRQVRLQPVESPSSLLTGLAVYRTRFENIKRTTDVVVQGIRRSPTVQFLYFGGSAGLLTASAVYQNWICLLVALGLLGGLAVAGLVYRLVLGVAALVDCLDNPER